MVMVMVMVMVVVSKLLSEERGGGALLRFGADGEAWWRSGGAMVRWLASKNHSDL